ncbi:MAG: hypothetical protein EB161_09155, partial [Nitrosopumilaceae archaeon]|nr:hypothetical protein [Nitrosopumilaceae archaeon]
MTVLTEDTSEEDIRQSVSKYLGELNLDSNQIKHEETIGPIRVFSNIELKIKGKNTKTAKGRIDIITRNDDGLPLFVVETKKPEVDVLEGKEQAISYARLVLAPLVVLTNGTQTILIDPFTRDGAVIDSVKNSNYFKNGLDVRIDDDLRYEALSNFIGYDLDNLSAFCKSQRKQRMYNLKGTLTQLDRKYIPELFVSPKNLDVIFQQFIASDKTAF